MEQGAGQLGYGPVGREVKANLGDKSYRNCVVCKTGKTEKEQEGESVL